MGHAAESAEDNVGLSLRDSRPERCSCDRLRRGVREPRRASTSTGHGAVLFDGTFYREDELVRLGLSKAVAKDMAHLPISGESGSLARLASLKARKIYTHINNTNPILAPSSEERRAVEAAGWEVAFDGMEISHERRAERSPMDADAFVARLRAEGEKRYHDRHPFHIAMHAGKLSREQIQAWVRNRFYYQTRIPIKDAIILSKSEDPGVPARCGCIASSITTARSEGEGGLAQWLRLAHGVGLDVDEVKSLRDVLPGRSLRVRRLRAARARAAARRGGRVVAHRVLRAGHHGAPHRRLGDALPVGRGRDARVLPRPRDPREGGLARGHRLRARARDDARGAGALHRRAHHEDARSSGRCSTPSSTAHPLDGGER